jgi:hypothetical protein
MMDHGFRKSYKSSSYGFIINKLFLYAGVYPALGGTSLW